MAVYIAIEWWSQVMCFVIHPVLKNSRAKQTVVCLMKRRSIFYTVFTRLWSKPTQKQNSHSVILRCQLVIVVKTVIHLCGFFFLFVTDNWPNVLSVWDIATHALSRMTFIWRAENNHLNHGPGIEIHDLNSLTSHGKLSESCDELFLVSTACGPHRRSLHVWQNTEKCCDLTGSCLSFHTRW